MTSLVARFASRVSTVLRSTGAALDHWGKGMEVAKKSESLIPSTRFVAVDGAAPTVAEECFVAPSASVIGDVTIGKHTSVWYGAIIRGDVNTIKIGEGSSIGDRAVVHVAKIQGDHPTTIGNHVTIGAGALIHAATLENGVVVGEMAQVLDGAVVGENSVIAPGAVLTAGTKTAKGELWSGAPAKKVRELTEEEIAQTKAAAFETIELASMHDMELSKNYKQVVEEEEERTVTTYLNDPATPKRAPEERDDVLGQGAPGQIFRSTLTHPHLKNFKD